jgi:hypothetical protein
MGERAPRHIRARPTGYGLLDLLDDRHDRATGKSGGRASHDDGQQHQPPPTAS